MSKTKFVLITSIDDDQEKLLSSLNGNQLEKFVLELDQNNSNKRNVFSTDEEICSSPSSSSKGTSTKRRKADLTCVICGGKAIGYNFAQISCESCKAFFRRNALQPLERIKCLYQKDLTNEIRCSIRSEMKQKCPRCRLLKCFQSGMRKDYILTAEEKHSKKQRLEENRRLRSIVQNSSNDLHKEKEEKTVKIESICPLSNEISPQLTNDDWNCLNQMRNAYTTACQSAPSASSMISLELAPDKISAFINTLDIQNFTAVKLINFLREIREFDQLDDHDRLILVKYNLLLLFLIRHSLTFDPRREICYDLEPHDIVSADQEAFALHCKSLFILCYGYEFNQTVVTLLNSLSQLTDRDPIVVQLLMLMMIFSKGLSADDYQEPLLNDPQRVFHAQSKYTDLLFRYFLEKLSFEQSAKKIALISEQLLKIQKVSRDFQLYVKSKVDLTHINPLMKSLLHLT